jgi:phosphoribosylformylglycinamidine cyclo-ligase
METQDSEHKTQDSPLTYAQAGVDAQKEEQALSGLLEWVNKTLAFRKGLGRSHLEIGFFATVVEMGGGMGLALTADGVGTKLLVAEMLGKYDTVGIDCVAMNVNDLICVGAEPICLLNYLAIEEPRADILEQIGKGLYEGARQANISIPGGETAQLKEMLKGSAPGLGFDLAGMGIGLIPLEKVNVGEEIQAGDALIGLASSGIHSNGLTLARRIFFDKLGWKPDRFVADLGRTIGEELLEPTRIYVRPILEMLSRLPVKGLANITGGGLQNLRRFKAEVGFLIEELPPAPPIFRLIQECGNIALGEMFTAFNMGIGFCVVVSEEDVEAAIAVCRRHGIEAWRIGRATADKERKIGRT